MSMPNVCLGDDGIIRTEYGNNAIVGINKIRFEYEQRLSLSQKPTPLMVILHGLASFSREAQEFLCGPEHCAITKAAAIVMDQSAGYYEHSKILISIFKYVDRPSFDMEIFDDEPSAAQWLSKYLGN